MDIASILPLLKRPNVGIDDDTDDSEEEDEEACGAVAAATKRGNPSGYQKSSLPVFTEADLQANYRGLDCKRLFRFTIVQITSLLTVLDVPEFLKLQSGHRITGLHGMNKIASLQATVSNNNVL